MKDGGDRVPHGSFVAPGKTKVKMHRELLHEVDVLRHLFQIIKVTNSVIKAVPYCSHPLCCGQESQCVGGISEKLYQAPSSLGMKHEEQQDIQNAAAQLVPRLLSGLFYKYVRVCMYVCDTRVLLGSNFQDLLPPQQHAIRVSPLN